MKKILFVLALLLVFSIFYSCTKTNEAPVYESSEITSEETTAEDTAIRISQSTLPPLNNGEGENSGEEGGGNPPPVSAVPSGNSDWFSYETNNSSGSNLNVGEDAGFGGEVGIVK